MPGALHQKSVLIVEDDYYLAKDLERQLDAEGARIVGPLPTVHEALKLLASGEVVSGAVLDVKLGDGLVFPLADELQRRGVPFIFATGYEPDIIPARHIGSPLLRKPLDPATLVDALLNDVRRGDIPSAEPGLNGMLSRLPSDELEVLLPHLRYVHLRRGSVMETPHQIVGRVYFPLDCVSCLIASSAQGTKVGTGLIGREGMTAWGLAYGDNQTPCELISQIDGSALTVSAVEYQHLLVDLPVLRTLSLRFARTLEFQVSITALTSTKYGLKQRLARWLLMIDDRASSNPFSLTHDYVALMLGVRRPSVTETLHILEGDRLIKASRNQIEILNRRGLVKIAAGIYGPAEDEYRRVMSLPQAIRLN